MGSMGSMGSGSLVIALAVLIALAVAALAFQVQAQVTYDTTPPTSMFGPFTSPTGNPRPVFKGWSNDSLTGVWQILWNRTGTVGGNITGTFTPGNSVYFNFTPGTLAAGTYTVTVNATDYAQNSEPTPLASATIVIQSSLPWSDIKSPTTVHSPYNNSKWTAEGSPWGSYGDDVGIVMTRLRIQRLNDSWYWDGVKFIAAPTWVPTLMNPGPPSIFGTWSYSFTPPQDQYYLFQTQSVDADVPAPKTEVPGPGETILYDNTPPSAWFDPLLPAWSNTTALNVSWNGTDNGFPIYYFTIAWKNLTYNVWNHLLNNTGPGWTYFGNSYPVNVTDGETYTFRVNATDSAFNTGPPTNTTSTRVDSINPVCSLSPLPTYSTTFNLIWTATDDLSGVAKTDAYWTTTPWNTSAWNWTQQVPGIVCTGPGPTGYTGCSAADGVYYFSCNATDVAGSVGPLGNNTINTTVDTTNPTSAFNQLPDWSRVTQLNVSATGSDAVSGLQCFNIQYKKTTDASWSWVDGAQQCTPPLAPYNIFGPTSPTTVADGDNFTFRVRATDNAGNFQPWPADSDLVRITNTTIDTLLPSAYVAGQDQTGRVLAQAESGSGITSVKINGSAIDTTSGIATSTIDYWVTVGGVISHYTSECGPAGPGVWSNCSVDVAFAEGYQLKYRTLATDVAGNSQQTGYYFIGGHPLANFVTHEVFVTLGSSFLAEVQVRNLKEEQVDVTLTISGYEPSGFLEAGTGDYVITEAGKKLTVLGLNPYEERSYQVQVLSAEPEGYVPYLDLVAVNSLSGGDYVTDSDRLAITTGFPASFSGLNEWAVALLIGLSVASYFFLGRRLEL